MTPEWRKKLRPASFRGVAFKIEGHELTGGRRGVQHQYAQKEKPYGEDTGRKGKQFTVEGYVLGADYFGARDALMEALDSEGAGELIHPYLGRQVVNCFDYKLSEQSGSGGMAVFRMTFSEAGEVEFPSVTVDPAYTVDKSAGSAIDQAKSNFTSGFSIKGLPGFVIEDATAKVSAFADLIEKSAGRFSYSNEGLSQLSYAVRKLRSNTTALLQSPGDLANEIAGTMNILSTISTDATEIFNGLKSFFGFGSDDKPVPVLTETRKAQERNRHTMDQMIQIVGVAEASRAATKIEYGNTQDAIVVRDAITDKLDDTMEVTQDDQTFLSLQDLRTQVVKAVPPPDYNLASIAKLVNNETRPSLVLTYDLYENPKYDDDIVKRNKLRHPGFVPGGKELEVLQVE